MTTARSSREALVVLEAGKGLIKALRDGSSEALEQLQEYADHFEEWQRGWKRAQGVKASVSQRDMEIGRRIAQQHATVLELVEEMRDSMEHSLKNLRGWTRGLRAYVDHFPKRIGTIRPRKG